MTTITTERLLAVQRALSEERVADEVDILLDSIVVALLSDGVLAEEALVRRVCEMWPGAGLQVERVTRAAEAGLRAKVLTRQDTLDGAPGYGLVAGAETNAVAASRVDEILDRTREAVRSRFEIELGRDLVREEAENLTGALIEALAAGIREAFAVFAGGVRSLASDNVIPEQWNEDAIRSVLDGYPFDQATREVLGALALSALDPASRFGSDIVTQIATGYVLHAFVARRDQASAIEQVGTVGGIRVFIDTPYLLEITGNTPVGSSLWGLVSAAQRAGVSVVAPEHYLAELERLLDGVQNGPSVETVRRALAEGSDPYVLAQSLDEGPLRVWLSHINDTQKLSWDQYRAQVRELPKVLRSRGVTVSKAPDTAQFIRLRNRLMDVWDEVLRETPRRGQGDDGPSRDAVRDDAATLAMLADARSVPQEGALWPRAWVLTPDRRMTDAYARHAPHAAFPATVSPTQIATLLATFVRPSDPRQLAQAAATVVGHDTMLKISSRYPTAVAVRIAQTLRPDGPASEVDLRLAQQTSIVELLEAERSSPDQLPDQVGASISDRRARRREELSAQERDHARRERDDAVLGQEKAEAERQASSLAAQRAADEEAKRRDERERKLEAEARAASRQRDEERARAVAADARAATYRRRGVVVAVCLILAAVAGALSWLTDLHALASGTALTSVLLLFFGWDWAAKPDVPWSRFGRTFLPELLGILDFIGG